MGSCCAKEPVIRRQSTRVTEYSKFISLRKQYEFVRILGNGSFGKVRLFRNIMYKDTFYAIKTLKKERIAKHLYDCLINEVNILSSLDHPNIVKYYETVEDDNNLHIVMEFLEGDDLLKVFKKEEFDEFTMCKMIKQILKALLFIHNKNIIHRDIKPENIIFSKKDDYSTLKLIDFGLSTSINQNDHKSVGSPYYMSPESILGHFTPKSDVWSIGVILFVLLTGEFPFNEKGTDELFSQIKNKPYEKSFLDESEWSDEVKELVSKMLIKDAKKRISTQDALKHPWFKKFNLITPMIKGKFSSITQEVIDTLKQFYLKTSLQKEILYFMARITKDEELTKLTDMFNDINESCNGSISKDELKKALNSSGIKITNDEIHAIWEGMDFHKDDVIHYTEFITAMISPLTLYKEEKLYSAFQYFEDQEDDGFITCESLIQAAKAFNISLNEKSLRQGFKEEKIDYVAFKHMLSSSSNSNSQMLSRTAVSVPQQNIQNVAN